MLRNIAIGSLLMIVTTAIHAAFMMLTFRVLRSHDRRQRRQMVPHRLVTVAGSVLLMFGASLVEVSAWAGTYLVLGAISSAEPAVYFSAVTFTTLGYGDLVLEPGWRMLASFEAANGIMMFGWTTAMIVAVVQRVYRPSES